jgi:hypothetical protein
VGDYRTKSSTYRNGSRGKLETAQIPLGKDFDIILALGPGLNTMVMQTILKGSIRSKKRILWNSEAVQLPEYYDKLKSQGDFFDIYFTFDQAELSIYEGLGHKAYFMPQGYNPKWYKYLNQKPNNNICFVGSLGGKWPNRERWLKRITNSFPVNVYSGIFNAEEVNKIYNDHKVCLNLGLYIKEMGHIDSYRCSGYQQRVAEIIGAGSICLTPEINSDDLFPDGGVVYYNCQNLESQIFNSVKNYELLRKKVLQISPQHTYKARMRQMIDTIEGLI